MIICPNCEHINPDSASQCENCFTALPQMTLCPHCHAPVQSDATFCGNCGESLSQQLPAAVSPPIPEVPPVAPPPHDARFSRPDERPDSQTSPRLPGYGFTVTNSHFITRSNQ
ncbi:MAG: hypothetical protein N5P05_001568 [Chroococcopsis gigantea SAG 12.99]|nr:hypothetical protein [Chroococcopsis gigantea SAG 12.99]